MAIRLGDEAPNFTAETTEGTVDLYDYLGDGWGMLFSHPKDFTPGVHHRARRVRPAQGRVRPAQREADRRERRPARLPPGLGQATSRRRRAPALNYPLIADPERKVADLYDMIHPNASDTMTVRSVFIIGPDKKVKLMLTYPASTGRNVDELLRVIDSLQLTANYQVATPVNWNDGDDVIIRAAVSRRGREGEVPEGVGSGQAVPAHHAPAEQVAPLPSPLSALRARAAWPRLAAPQDTCGADARLWR